MQDCAGGTTSTRTATPTGSSSPERYGSSWLSLWWLLALVALVTLVALVALVSPGFLYLAFTLIRIIHSRFSCTHGGKYPS